MRPIGNVSKTLRRHAFRGPLFFCSYWTTVQSTGKFCRSKFAGSRESIVVAAPMDTREATHPSPSQSPRAPAAERMELVSWTTVQLDLFRFSQIASTHGSYRR